MSEFQKDALTNRWVLQAPHRGQNRQALSPTTLTDQVCPLCAGNEALLSPEIDAIRSSDNNPEASSWVTRVIPCPQPLLSVEQDFVAHHNGLYEQFSGVGAHELVVDCPQHDLSLADLPVKHLSDWLRLIRRRLRDLRGDFRLRYFTVFKNQGALAGAYTRHSCTHLLGLPVAPPLLRQRLDQSRSYYRRHERCYTCDTIAQELREGDRIILEEANFVLWAPHASTAPFEMVLAPRQHQHDFSLIDDAALPALARLLQQALKRLRVALEDPAWQLLLYTAPPPHPRPGHPEMWHSLQQDTHWEFRLRPCLNPPGAFETLLGGFINPVAADEAARYLRELHF